jgi:peptide/nickel transport system substrate-binding protein
MWPNFITRTSAYALVVTIVAIAGVACGGAQDTFSEDITSQFSPDRENLPAPTMNQGEYVAPRIPPGGYPTFLWEGPMPTQFNESPFSAQLVKEGKILPLEERLPVADDIFVVPLDNEVGIYGGTMRVTASVPGKNDGFTTTGCFRRDADGIGRVTAICKDMKLSEDGRTYTFTLRNGARWSDGYPITMEDFRFAWEDLNLNREYMERLPLTLVNPITGNGPKFEVIDDLNWTLTFDSPMYTLIESKSGAIFSGTKGCNSSPCFYSASHVYKRYHPKYGSEDEIRQLVRFYSRSDWKGVMQKLQQKREFLGVQSKPVPTEFDPDYIYDGDHYAPWPGGYVTTALSDQKNQYDRNHYFMGVDPLGNQLPYMDSVVSFQTESREVAVFRCMAGECDIGGEDLILSEIPLYLASAEKGDYSLEIYRAAAGSDTTVLINQEYNEDQEIGAMMRSKDFRLALSYAWNRSATNETVLAGLGTPQNWTPHPTTPYYPGDEWASKDIEFNPDKARELLANLGFVDANEDGFLDRKDGTGPVELYFEAYDQYYSIIELLQKDWSDVGIKLIIREGGRSYQAAERNKQYFVMSSSSYGDNPWQVAWTRLVPLVKGNQLAPTIGEYYQTGGREGMAPGVNSEFQPAAPADTYPADSSGKLQYLQGLWTQGRVIPQFSDKRIELGKEIYRTVADSKYHIGGLAFTGIFRGIRMRRNNVRNTPKNHFPSGRGGTKEAFYFEDGLDNTTHPGNRSKKYRSVHFLDPAYWD